MDKKNNKYIRMIMDESYRFNVLSEHGFMNFLSDEKFLKLKFKHRMGYNLDLLNPKSYSEKLQWLKLYNRNPLYTTLVDKYLVKEYVEKIIGVEYIIPTLAKWNSVDDINFDILPDKFVLKCNHDSGGIVICSDKKKLDKRQAQRKLKKHFNRNGFWYGREWPYKNIEKCIIAESFLVDESQTELKDYKFLCFNGEVKLFEIHSGRFTSHKQFFYDREGNVTSFNQCGYTNNNAISPDMTVINDMIKLAEKVAKGMPHVRVDFYYANSRIYFGEITFFDGSGFTPFKPREWDFIIGKWLELPKMKESEV